MVCGLCAVLHLAKAFMNIAGSLADRLGEQFRIHEVGAGTRAKIAAVFD